MIMAFLEPRKLTKKADTDLKYIFAHPGPRNGELGVPRPAWLNIAVTPANDSYLRALLQDLHLRRFEVAFDTRLELGGRVSSMAR